MSTIMGSPNEISDMFRKYVEGKQNHMNAFEMLPDSQKDMIFTLVTDMLPDQKLKNCGVYFNKLLDLHNMTYTSLANYILGYIECIEENPDDKAISQIKSSLKSLSNAISFENDNYIIRYVCDFFSISEDVLQYGYGKKYVVNMEKVAEVFDKQQITKNEFLEGIFYKMDMAEESYQKNCDKYINYSHKVFAEMVENAYYTDNILDEEEFSLLDKDAFDNYFNKLTIEEQYAVYRLMNNMKKS